MHHRLQQFFCFCFFLLMLPRSLSLCSFSCVVVTSWLFSALNGLKQNCEHLISDYLSFNWCAMQMCLNSFKMLYGNIRKIYNFSLQVFKCNICRTRKHVSYRQTGPRFTNRCIFKSVLILLSKIHLLTLRGILNVIIKLFM